MKKKGILIIIAAMLAAVIASTFTDLTDSAVMAAIPAAVTLDTQKIVFLRTLKDEYSAIDTWINEADDLSSFVVDGQKLIFPEAGGEPAVYRNRQTDIDSIEPTEMIHSQELDVYDTQNYKIRNIHLHALPFDKISYYMKRSAKAIVKSEIEDAAYNLSPENSGSKRIILPSTGSVRAGLKMFTLDDIVTLARACDSYGFPTSGRNVILPSDMWWDLINNNPILKGQLERQPMTGIINPLVVNYYGFKIHKSEQKLGLGFDLNSNKKAPQGTIIAGDVVPCGFMFISSNAFRASGKFEMTYTPFGQNPTGRAHEFGFQHRFKSGNQMSDGRYSALVYLSLADPVTEPEGCTCSGGSGSGGSGGSES
jgi:hypothetical protein